MKQVELDQKELRAVITILCQVSYKLGDAKIVLPLVEKLEAYLDPEEPKTEVAQPN